MSLLRCMLGVALVWGVSVGSVFADLGPPSRKLPNATFRVLPNGTNPKATVSLLPMAKLLGKPIAVIYWKLNDTASETELKAFQALAKLPNYKGKIQFFTAVKASTTRDEAAAIKRARQLKLTVPLILDRSQLAPYIEAWFAFPRYGLIDKTGKVKVWNCRQLSETVGPGMTFMNSLQAMSEGKKIPTMRGITKPNNTYELAGKKAPDVGLNDTNDKATTVSKYIKNKPLIIAFWSVTCPHCRQVIPAVAKYWQQRKGNLDMVSITRAPSESLRKMIRDLYKTAKVTWPVAYAPENATLSFYNIVKVPTVLIVDKKGVIRYVWIQPDAKWIGAAIEAALLKYNLF